MAIREINILGVEEGDNNHGSKEVDDGGCEHHVETARGLFVERNAAPGRLEQSLLVEDQIVDLEEPLTDQSSAET